MLAIVGVFGTWRTTESVSLDGFEGPHNGWLVIIFGLIALAGVAALSLTSAALPLEVAEEPQGEPYAREDPASAGR